MLITATYEPIYGLDGATPVVNQVDHRAVGLAVLDAARDAGNRWIFPELLDEDLPPWPRVREIYVMGSAQPTHAVDVTDALRAGVDSLRPRRLPAGAGPPVRPEQFLTGLTAAAGHTLGVPHAVAFGRITLHGV